MRERQINTINSIKKAPNLLHKLSKLGRFFLILVDPIEGFNCTLIVVKKKRDNIKSID